MPLILEFLPYGSAPGCPFLDILLERVMKLRSRSAAEVHCEFVNPKAEMLPAHVRYNQHLKDSSRDTNAALLENFAVQLPLYHNLFLLSPISYQILI